MKLQATVNTRIYITLFACLGVCFSAFSHAEGPAADATAKENPFHMEDCPNDYPSTLAMADLAQEICRRANQDQIAVWVHPPKSLDHLNSEQWMQHKEGMYKENRIWAETVIREHGYPGNDMVGEKASSRFWLMLQHADFDPEFQIYALSELKKQVDKNNASKRNYCYLIDRVRTNTQQPQVYGTQVSYNFSTGQALPRNLENPSEVNIRRAAMDLEPIEDYINDTTQLHYQMNQASLEKKGIMKPPQFAAGELVELYKNGSLK